jgi:FKBP-type peptidyl-prolyl cis-trans isomerase
MKKRLRLAALVAVALICAACGTDVPALSSAAPLCSQSSVTVSNDSFAESVSLVTTPRGVQYGDIRPGCGALAVPGKRLTIAYSFWLQNGQLFATSRAQGAGPGTFTYGSGQPFPGFDLGFANMRVGGKRRIVVPPALAYGPQGLPPAIPPNATLVVDVQLLRVSWSTGQ